MAQRRFKQIVKFVTAACASFAALFLLLILITPLFLNSFLEKKFAQVCHDCRLEIGSSRLLIFSPGIIEFTLLELNVGQAQSLKTSLKVARLRIEGSLKSLIWERKLVIDRVEMHSPHLTLLSVGPDNSSKTKKSSPPPLPFQLNLARIYDGTFLFERKREGKVSRLEINSMNGSLEQIRPKQPTPSLWPTLRAQLKAKVEGDDPMELFITTTPFQQPTRVDIELIANHQSIGVLTPFLSRNSGVVVKGEIIKGKSKIAVRDRSLEATLTAQYKDLDVSFVKTKDRGKTKTYLMNLASDMALEKTNVEKGKPKDLSETTATINTERESDETLIAFILRGLALAAIKLQTN